MSLPELTLTTDKSQRNVQINQLTVRQSEKGLTLIANIASGDGLPYDLTGLTLQFCENKRDGKAIIDPAVSILDSKNGRISYVLHSQAYACSGSAWFEILNGTTLVDSTQNFSIKVESTTNVNVDSSDYIWDTQLADTIKKAGDIEAQSKAVLDDIQKNPDKYRGVKGDAGTIKIGTVTAGPAPTVTNVGTASDATLDFTLVKGDKGDTGSVDNAGLTTAPAFQALQTQVNNSAVGTNLITNSNFSSGLNHWNVNSGTNSDCKATVITDSDGDTCIHITGTGNVCGIYCAPVSFNQNQVTTGSLLAKGIGTLVTVGLADRPRSNFGTISTESYSKIGSTTQASAVSTNIFGIFFNTINGVIDVYIKFAKLEKGSVATDWCLNPTEVLTQSDYAKIKAAIVALGGYLK